MFWKDDLEDFERAGGEIPTVANLVRRVDEAPFGVNRDILARGGKNMSVGDLSKETGICMIIELVAVQYSFSCVQMGSAKKRFLTCSFF